MSGIHIEDDLDDVSEDDFRRRSARRCAYFLSAFESYQKKLATAGVSNVTMDKVLLANCVESYFLDIRRLKVFHGMERADKYKIAGYSMKWLCKIKPIQVSMICNLPSALKKRALLVNVDFAFITAMSISKVNPSLIDPRQRHGLLYTGHYRDLDGGIMALKMELLARAYPRDPAMTPPPGQ